MEAKKKFRFRFASFRFEAKMMAVFVFCFVFVSLQIYTFRIDAKQPKKALFSHRSDKKFRFPVASFRFEAKIMAHPTPMLSGSAPPLSTSEFECLFFTSIVRRSEVYRISEIYRRPEVDCSEVGWTLIFRNYEVCRSYVLSGLKFSRGMMFTRGGWIFTADFLEVWCIRRQFSEDLMDKGPLFTEDLSFLMIWCLQKV
jgi:hypothetical protein